MRTRGSRRHALLSAALVGLACQAADPPAVTSAGSLGSSSGSGETTGPGATATATATSPLDGSSSSGEDAGATGDPEGCSCAPGTDVIHVLSDAGELWSYDPIANDFALIGPLECGGYRPFSMAVDRTGMAWVLLLDNVALSTVAKGMFQVDIADASGCDPVVYEEGLFGAFGMSFVSNGPPDTCEKLYVQSYSGSGPFAEGPDLGLLGVLEDGVMRSVGPLDYDGGELAGTSDGRLFAFTGVGPVKLVELDKDTGAELGVLPLTGLSKTDASGMAFYGGDFYVFTESANPSCMPCLEANCADELAACEAEGQSCEELLDCLLAGGGEASGCQGDLLGAASALRDCMWGPCAADCNESGVVSRVLHVDWDDSDGGGQAVTIVEEYAPIRIVGAGSSTCVPGLVP